jgi:glucuronosyltransferase
MDSLLSNDVVQRVIQDQDSHYDLILLETFFMQELFVALGHKYNAPIINLNPIEPLTIASYYTGSPNPYSYVPRKLTTFGSNRMSFFERVLNTVGTLAELFVAHVYYLPQMVSIFKTF